MDGHVEVAGSPQRRIPLAEVAAAALAEGGPIAATGSAVSAPAPIDEATMRGAYFRHFNAPTFHVHLAEVEVDPETGRVTIVRYVVAQDVGRAINPNGIEGQIQGGVVQGVGYALYENIRIDGRGSRFLDGTASSTYRLPTASRGAADRGHPPRGPRVAGTVRREGRRGAADHPCRRGGRERGHRRDRQADPPPARTPFAVLAALRGEPAEERTVPRPWSWRATTINPEPSFAPELASSTAPGN